MVIAHCNRGPPLIVSISRSQIFEQVVRHLLAYRAGLLIAPDGARLETFNKGKLHPCADFSEAVFRVATIH